MNLIPYRTIICAPKNFEELKLKYPRRSVVPDCHCKNDEFVVIRKYSNGVFVIKMNDWSVWLPEEFPYFRRWK